MKILNIFRRQSLPFEPTQNATNLVFAGGLGTQIIQAASYWRLHDSGCLVGADLSYYDTDARLAKIGEVGTSSHWPWQLDHYGMNRDKFHPLDPEIRKGAYSLRDGKELMVLGLTALRRAEIRDRFEPLSSHGATQSFISDTEYICVHVRRGDYLNVASHVVPDMAFTQLSQKLKGLLPKVVFVSDSPFGTTFKLHIEGLFHKAIFLDDIDPLSSHWIMRQARILVCSNSTFSLTAAMLNPEALVILPKKWFGPDDQHIATPIQDLCTFQIIS